MAEPVMENPLSPTPSLGAHHAKLLQDMKDCISELKQEFDDSGGYPINDDSQPLQRMCAKLEYLLQSGLKSKSSFLGGKKDYWNYICDCLSSNKSLNDGVKFVKSISELRTSLGRGRAFLRFCLMHQRTADTLQHCVCNLHTTSEWYTTKAFWFDRRLVSELLNTLYDLNNLQFDLSPRGYDLDASWPTFARRNFGSPYSWQAPSRTTSFGSLSSIPTMENIAPLSVSPQIQEDAEGSSDQSDNQRQAQDAEQAKLVAKQEKLEAEKEKLVAEKEKLTAEKEKAVAEQAKQSAQDAKIAAEKRLEQAQRLQEGAESRSVDLAEEVTQLRTKLQVVQHKCTEYEVMADSLKQQLELKEAVWKEKEEMLRTRADDVESMVNGLRGDLDQSSKTTTPSERFDLMELRGQVVVQRKKCQAAEIQLKSSQLELQAKERINQKKTELIDLLDRKLQQQKQKVDYLMTTAEKLVKEKEEQSTKLSNASDELIKLSNKYIESEKLQKELRHSNTELKAMLSSIEGKGKQLVGMAKDKVKSFSDQNRKLQEEVDGLRQERDRQEKPPPLADSARDLEVILRSSCHEILEQVAQLVAKENLDSDGQRQLAEIRERLQGLEAARDDLHSNTGDQALLDELKAKLEEAQRENERLTTTLAENSPARIPGSKADDTDTQQEGARMESPEEKGGEVEAELRKELERKDAELEKVKSELGAIRNLVLQSVTGTAPKQGDDVSDVCDGDQSTLDLLGTVLPPSGTSQPIREQDSDHMTSLLLESAELKTRLSLETMTSADIQARLEQAAADLQVSQDKIASAELDSSQAQAERDELLRLVTDLGGQITDKDGQIVELTAKTDEFQRALGEYQESHEATVREKNQLQEQVRVTEASLAEMEANVLCVVESVTDLRGENEALLVARDDLQAELDSLVTERDQLQRALDAAQAGSDNELQRLRDQVVGKSAEVEMLMNQSARLEAELCTEKLSSQEARQQKQAVEGELHSLKTHQAQQDDKAAKIFELENQIDDLKMTAIDAQKKQEDLHVEISTLESRVREFESQLETERTVKAEAENQAKEFNFSFLTTKAELEEVKAHVEELEETVTEKEQQLDEQRALVRTKEEDNSMIRSELEEARAMVQAFQVIPDSTEVCQNDDEAPAKDSLQSGAEGPGSEEARVGAVESADTQKTAVLLPNVQVENINLRQQIERLVGNKDALCQKLVSEKSALGDQLKELIGQVEDKNRAFDNLEIKYHQLEEESEELKRDNDGKTEAIQTLMANMELAKVEMESLRQSVVDLEASRQEVKSLQAEVAGGKQELSRQADDWARDRDAWQKEVSALRFQMSAQEMEYQDMIKTLDGRVSEQDGLQSQVSHQEALVETLELELRQLREEKEQATDRGAQLHQELQRILKENKILSRELVLTNEVVQKERRELARLKHTMDDQERHLSTFAQTQEETKLLLEGDNAELKKRLIQLLKEKDTLWQRIARLEHVQRLRQSDVWVDSSTVTHCTACSTEFTIIVRKHHCRMCGRVFCRDCCNSWVLLPHSSKQERVCHECLMSHSQLEPTSVPPSDLSDLTESVQIPEKRSTKWSTSSESASVPVFDDDLGLRSATALVQDGEGDSSQEGEGGGEPARAVVDPIAPDMAIKDPTSPSLDPTAPSSDLTGPRTPEADGTESLTLDEEKLLSMTDDTKSGAAARAASSEKCSSEEEAYDLITEDEVLQSLCEPLPDPNTMVHPTVTCDQLQESGALCPPDLWIPAGKSYVVPVLLTDIGTILHWHFSTKPKGISFGLTYKENSFVTVENQETLLPTCRCDSHKEAVVGDLTARRPGIYCLLFDNTSSRFTAKKLEFSLSVTTGGAYVT